MAHNETEIGSLLKQGKEQEAADAVLALLEQFGGNVQHAALEIGVHRATLKRWIARLVKHGWDMRENLLRIRRAGGAPEAMTSDELESAKADVRAARERARCLAWLRVANEVQIAYIAAKARVPCANVKLLRIANSADIPHAQRILAVVGAEIERQRKAWRDARLAKSINQG